MLTLDNGNVQPPETINRYTPILNGDIYCCLACGYNCKKADFDFVTKKANDIAKKLGSGWELRVWENLGWHFQVKKGVAVVSLNSKNVYTASLEFQLSENHTVYFKEFANDPCLAVELVSIKLQKGIANIKRAMLSVQIDALEVEFKQQ